MIYEIIQQSVELDFWKFEMNTKVFTHHTLKNEYFSTERESFHNVRKMSQSHFG